MAISLPLLKVQPHAILLYTPRALSLISLVTSGPAAIADAIKDMRALSLLNLAQNSLGELVLPKGWKMSYNYSENELNQKFVEQVYRHTDGREQKDNPGKPEGIIAIANAIPDMGAISTVNVNTFPLPIQDIKCKTELDFSGKQLKVEDAIIIAALIPLNVSRTIFPHPCYH